MKTGYEIGLNDFRQLLSERAYRAEIAPLMQQWFGYEFDGSGSYLCDLKGGLANIEQLHEAIQCNRKLQSDLYQTAMSLWR